MGELCDLSVCECVCVCGGGEGWGGWEGACDPIARATLYDDIYLFLCSIIRRLFRLLRTIVLLIAGTQQH